MSDELFVDRFICPLDKFTFGLKYNKLAYNFSELELIELIELFELFKKLLVLIIVESGKGIF